MPPHYKHSAQHHLPPGIKETANKRKSGAIDHTWTRIPGSIGNGHSSMLPFWVLLAASRPVQVILASYAHYHKLVRPVDENKETGIVKYKWYLPILKHSGAPPRFLTQRSLPLSTHHSAAQVALGQEAVGGHAPRLSHAPHLLPPPH